MKINFAIKVPFRERIKILFRRGLYVEFDYKGQFFRSDITVKMISGKEVDHANKNRSH